MNAERDPNPAVWLIVVALVVMAGCVAMVGLDGVGSYLRAVFNIVGDVIRNGS